MYHIYYYKKIKTKKLILNKIVNYFMLHGKKSQSVNLFIKSFLIFKKLYFLNPFLVLYEVSLRLNLFLELKPRRIGSTVVYIPLYIDENKRCFLGFNFLKKTLLGKESFSTKRLKLPKGIKKQKKVKNEVIEKHFTAKGSGKSLVDRFVLECLAILNDESITLKRILFFKTRLEAAKNYGHFRWNWGPKYFEKNRTIKKLNATL